MTRNRKTPKGALVLIFLGAALAITVGIIGMRGNRHGFTPIAAQTKPAMAPIPERVRPTAPEIRRPKRWLTEPAFAEPTEVEIVRFHSLFKTPIEFEHAVSAPYKDAKVIGLIHDAQRLIKNRGVPNGAWRGEKLLRVVMMFGVVIPFVEVYGRIAVDSNVFLAYDYAADKLVLRTSVLRGVTVEAVAGMLVHEATHVVFKEAYLDWGGLTIEQFVHLQDQCPDTSQMNNFVTEALAYGNQQLWCDAVGEKLEVCAPRLENIMRAAHDARQSRAGLNRYARLMLVGVYHNHPHPERDAVTRGCGPVVIQHGSRKDQFFFPSDLAPDFIVPLLDSIE